MLQLEELAKGEGAQTIAVETSMEKLRARSEPFICIALLDQNHFVVLHDVDDRSVHLVDAPFAKSLPVDTFRKAWTKKALLIGRGELQPEESIRLPIRWGRALAWGSGIVAVLFAIDALRRRIRRLNMVGRTAGLLALASSFGLAGCGGGEPAAQPKPSAPDPASLVVEPAEHRLGDVFRDRVNSTLETTTTLRNVGGEPLRIGSIRIGCTCTAASTSRDLIPPGETATLKASIKIGDSPEPRESSLTIFNSSPDRSAITVRYRWRAVNRVRVEPQACEWSRLRRGESAENSLEVIANGLSLCPSCVVEFKPGSEVLSCEVVSTTLDRPGHEEKAKTNSNRMIARLKIRVLGAGDMGSRSQDSVVTVRCGEEERAKVSVPGHWKVITPVEISPERLSLGLHRPGERVERRIVLASDDETPFHLGLVTCGQEGVVRGYPAKSSLSCKHLWQRTY